MLYKIMILEEGGEFEKALEALSAMRTKVLDQRGWKEARGWLSSCIELQFFGKPHVKFVSTDLPEGEENGFGGSGLSEVVEREPR